jgi:hypothetical protein
MRRTSDQSTPPSRWCVRTLALEVNSTEVHGVFGCKLLRAEHRREHRDQGHAAADAKQAGQEADERAGGEVGEHPGHGHARVSPLPADTHLVPRRWNN